MPVILYYIYILYYILYGSNHMLLLYLSALCSVFFIQSLFRVNCKLFFMFLLYGMWKEICTFIYSVGSLFFTK